MGTTPNNIEMYEGGFFNYIRNEFCNFIVQKMKIYMNNKFKLAKLINKQHFLLRCRKEKVCPKSRIFKNNYNIDTIVFSKLQNKFIFGTINEEINTTIKEIKWMKSTLNNIQQYLETHLPNTVYEEFLSRTESTFNFHFNQIKVRQKTKFNNILDNSNSNTINRISANENWIINVSNIDLPTPVKNILSLGEKFCPPTFGKYVPYFQIISDVESSIFDLCEIDKINIRNRFVNVLTNFKYNPKFQQLTPTETRISSYVKQTKSFLNNHPNLLILKADKGNVTVVTLREDYLEKMYTILNDSSTYIEILKNNTTPIQTNINKMVKEWEELGNIDLATRKKLTNYNSVIPKLYGLPKVHKLNLPYRPIVSSTNGPTYSLSLFLGNILKYSVGKTNSCITNSEDFKLKIKNIVIPQNYVIISLDVISLFTNIDKQSIINLISNDWKNIKKNSKSKLTKLQFLAALNIVLNNSEFSFDNKIYKQIFGSPMGSPISPIIANLFMEHLETVALNSLNFQPLFYYRYVDDIITAVPKNQIDNMLKIFNSIDKNNKIKFTLEQELNNKISFLDILLIHEPDGKISFDWYHKNTWSGRYLNFLSWLPISYKINTIQILCQKILKLSDNKFHDKNFQILNKTLLDNHYPQKLINKIIYKQVYLYPNPNSRSPNEKINYLTIPYIKNLFEKTKNLFKNYNYKIVGGSASNLKNSIFSKIKDPVPLNKQSNVVYKIKCDCNSTYVGQTKQLLEKRFYQHKSGTNKELNQNSSALTRHLKNFNHSITLDNVQILEKEQNYKKRSILEMLHIKKSTNSINIVEDHAYIGNTYDLFV